MLHCGKFFLTLLLLGLAGSGNSSPLMILQENCVGCHSPSKRKGGLLIDSRESLIAGGDTGAAIVPGEAKNSYLIESLFPDADSHMPPKDQLDPKAIAALEEWINTGAKWDAEQWKKLTRPKKAEVKLTDFPDLYAPVLAMALSPDGKTLASGRGNEIELFSVVPGDGKKLPTQLAFEKKLGGHPDLIQSLAFSPDGKFLISGGFRKLIFHNLADHKSSATYTEPFLGRLTALAISPDGNTLLIADSLPAQLAQIHSFDTGKRKVIHTIESAHDDAIYGLTFSPDGTRFASASADKMAIVRDTKDFKIITKLEGHTSYVLSLAFSPDGKRIATGGDDEAIKIWDAKDGTQIISFATAKSGPVGGVFWGIDPDSLAKQQKEKDKQKAEEINTDRIVTINDLGQPGTFTGLKTHEGGERSTGASERRHDRVESPLTAMAFDPVNLLLFAGTEDGRIFTWDKAGKKIQEINDPDKLAKASQ